MLLEESVSFNLGLASNVAANIAALGSTALLAGVVGYDLEAAQFIAQLNLKHIYSLLVTEKDRITTVKNRFISHHQHLLRVDREVNTPVSEHSEAMLSLEIQSQIANVSGIIIQDYNKGVVTKKLALSIFKSAMDHDIPVFVDPHPNTPLNVYKGAALVKPNKLEAQQLTKVSLENHTEEKLEKAAAIIHYETDCRHVVITLGEDGAYYFDFSTNAGGIINTVKRQIFDVSGAGDTMIAMLTVAICNGLNIQDAIRLANLAASIVVGKVGTATVTPQDIIQLEL